MTVTKRGLLKVIILLVIIDVIAGIWYLTLRIENSGESRDLFETTDSVTEDADTIATAILPDSFYVAENHGYFIAHLPSGQDGSTTLACKKLVHIKMPVTVNGLDSLDMLTEAVCEKAFNLRQRDINAAMATYISTPLFSNPAANASFTRVDSMQPVAAGNMSVHSIYIYPQSSSQRLLIMRIDYGWNNGTTSVTTSRFVHFDRHSLHVLTSHDIIKSDCDNELLKIINSKIAALNNQKSELTLHNATNLPGELCVRRSGISFYYAPGEIAPNASGEIEIFIPHDKLQDIYTPSFQSLVNNTRGWVNFNKP